MTWLCRRMGVAKVQIEPIRDLGARRVFGTQQHAPSALLTGKTRYPLCRVVGGSDTQSGRTREVGPPPGFDPPTPSPPLLVIQLQYFHATSIITLYHDV